MKKIIDRNELILGIDLGTTYSCASIMIDKNIVIIPNSLGIRTTPSYVTFLSENKICVGELAKLFPSNKKNIIYYTKRLLGKNINDMKNLPFNLINDNKFNKLKIEVAIGNKTKQYYPEQISAMILKKIKDDSEYYLTKKIGKKIKINNTVITVPAYFNQKQREATKNAAKIINLNVKGMINEPTAASLAYGCESMENKKILLLLLILEEEL